jgi:hypothetical protein
MNKVFSAFTKAMLWSTLLLMYLLGRWEHNLTLSDANHELVQVILVFIIFGWVYLWNSLDEQEAFSHYTSQKGKDKKDDSEIVAVYMDQGIPINSQWNSGSYSFITKEK